MTQTAIIIRHSGEEILVRLGGIHVDKKTIKVDTRSEPVASWQPYPPYLVQVRLESG